MILIREALEGLVEARTASAIVFDALGRAEAIPQDVDGLILFLEGPLHECTSRQAGSNVAASLVERVLAMFRAGSPSRDVATTLQLPRGTGPVRVMVLSRNTILSLRLRAALGPDVVGVAAVCELGKARTAIERMGPEVLILDGVEPMVDDPAALSEVIALVPSPATRAIWGGELRWAAAAVAAFAADQQEVTPVDRREGVEPLLDLIRSRLRSD